MVLESSERKHYTRVFVKESKDKGRKELDHSKCGFTKERAEDIRMKPGTRRELKNHSLP